MLVAHQPLHMWYITTTKASISGGLTSYQVP
jgi:hypothetical protein